MRRIFLTFLLLSSIQLYAQEKEQKDFVAIPSRYGYEINRYPKVAFNYFLDHRSMDWSPVLHISVQIQNDYLQFTKEKEFFNSEYEITISIRDNKQTIVSKTWSNKAQLKEFKLTNSKRDFQFNTYSVDLAEEAITELKPGEYEIFILLHDMLSSREYKNKRKMVVLKSNFKGPKIKTPHTEITFLKDNQLKADGNLNISATRNTLEFNETYFVFARIYSPDSDSLNANVRVYMKKDDQKSLLAQQFFNNLKIEKGTFKIMYPLPVKKMDEGDYSIRVTFETDGSYLEIERDFSVLWYRKPLYLYKVDLAVRPMKYLIPPAEMEKVKELSLEELEVWFADYWKKIDPTPETSYNELMTEFYNRVTESVRKYSNRFKEGWQTDRGMVLLLYGEPTKVEDRKYAANSIPHIIWKYKKDEGEQIFTFIDKNKTGDFTLVTEDTEKKK